MKLTDQQQYEITAAIAEGTVDTSLEPHILTDKDETKVVGCRVCKRPCIVTRFASASKTACLDHRDRRASVTVVHDLKADLEPHILTDKNETKQVPCRHCGRPCVVTRFASAPKVACLDCRKTTPRPQKTTEYKDNGDGRLVAETHTKVMDEHGMQWTAWTVGQPWHFDQIWVDDEHERHDKSQKAGAQADYQVKVCRRKISAKDRELTGLQLSDKNDKKAKKVEEEIDELTNEELSLHETATAGKAEASRISRIAYIRGALAHGYRIEQREGHRYLVGRERDVIIPDDFLEVHDYKIAESTTPAGV